MDRFIDEKIITSTADEDALKSNMDRFIDCRKLNCRKPKRL